MAGLGNRCLPAGAQNQDAVGNYRGRRHLEEVEVVIQKQPPRYHRNRSSQQFDQVSETAPFFVVGAEPLAEATAAAEGNEGPPDPQANLQKLDSGWLMSHFRHEEQVSPAFLIYP